MKFDPNSLFQSARSIRLRPEEFHAIRGQLKMSVIKTETERLSGTMDQQNFLESASHISLRADEKAIIREAIMTDMEAADALTPRPFHGWMRLFSGSMAVLVLFIACGAGVSYAAEFSLPGDALYGVKVSFTEPLLLRFNSSTEAKVRLAAMLVSRRLEEAEKLAEKSRLTAERVTIVQERLTAHIAALELDLKELARLDQETSSNIAIDTAAEMEAHEHLLLRIETDNDPKDVEKLINETRKARTIAEKVTVSADLDSLAAVKAQKANDEIKKTKTTKMWKQRSTQDANISDTILNAEIDLKASEEAAAAANVKVEKATSALNKAKEAKFMLLLPAHTKLKIGVSAGRKEPSQTTNEPSETKSEADVSASSVSSSVSSANAESSVSVGDVLAETDELIENSLPSRIID